MVGGAGARPLLRWDAMTTPEPPAGTGPDAGAPRLSPLWRDDPPKVGDYWLDARLTASPSGVAYVAHIYGFVAGVLLGLLARSPRAARHAAALPGRR